MAILRERPIKSIFGFHTCKWYLLNYLSFLWNKKTINQFMIPASWFRLNRLFNFQLFQRIHYNRRDHQWVFYWKPMVLLDLHRPSIPNAPTSTLLNNIPTFQNASPSIRSRPRIFCIHYRKIREELGLENSVKKVNYDSAATSVFV